MTLSDDRVDRCPETTEACLRHLSGSVSDFWPKSPVITGAFGIVKKKCWIGTPSAIPMWRTDTNERTSRKP